MTVARLARQASIELSYLDSRDFQARRDFLWPGQKVYVSHLPRQSWAQTRKTCTEVAAAGFEANLFRSSTYVAIASSARP